MLVRRLSRNQADRADGLLGWDIQLASKLIALGLLLLLAGCQKVQPVASVSLPVASVRVRSIELEPHVAFENVVGTVRPKLQSVIEAKVSGQIEKMLVVPGQQVKAGDLLVQLRVREIQAKLDEALATQRQTEDDLKRYTTLLQQRVVSQQDFDAVQTRARVAKAAAIEAETNLAYATITAPFDGVITRKLADVGDLASPGKPLVEIEDTKSLRLEADVPEAIVGNVEMGAKFDVRIESWPNDLEGIVSEIAPAGDPNSRTFVVKLDLPMSAGLRAGQFGRVAIPVGETEVLRTPASAVIRRGQMELIFVVVDQHAHLRLVKTGKHIGDEVELVSGVEPGEQVVIEGNRNLVDGQPVNIRL
jgi:membrane fusion protein (multidrug efflux system)